MTTKETSLLDTLGNDLKRRDNKTFVNNVKSNVIPGREFTQTDVVRLARCAVAFRDAIPETITLRRFLQLCGVM